MTYGSKKIARVALKMALSESREEESQLKKQFMQRQWILAENILR